MTYDQDKEDKNDENDDIKCLKQAPLNTFNRGKFRIVDGKELKVLAPWTQKEFFRTSFLALGIIRSFRAAALVRPEVKWKKFK